MSREEVASGDFRNPKTSPRACAITPILAQLELAQFVDDPSPFATPPDIEVFAQRWDSKVTIPRVGRPNGLAMGHCNEGGPDGRNDERGPVADLRVERSIEFRRI